MERLTDTAGGPAAGAADARAPIVLALNSGSSSLKFGLYRAGERAPERLFSGEAEAIGSASSTFRLRNARGELLLCEPDALPGQLQACERIGRLFEEQQLPPPAAIGHRVVHGGIHLRRHCLIDAAVLDKLQAAVEFAPLHVPAALSVIRLAGRLFPGRAQVACFDTAFHAGLPEVTRTLPLPRELRDEGVQRFGFHGLSCESVVQQFGSPLPSRLVIAHLGSGASVTAVRDGHSIDTSMGLTPSGGVMMATRCGDLDPGVLAYLVRERQFDAAALEQLIDHRSGMLGVSSLSGDLRRLREAAGSNQDARLAIAMFGYSVRKQIAAMTAALGGIDALVFTGGIGEHDADMRAEICHGLAWAGIVLDASRNQQAAEPISAGASRCQVRVVPCAEEVQIARHTRELLA